MKLFFGSLLIALTAISAKATAETDKCNYEFKFTDRYFERPYSSEDPGMSPDSRAYYKQLETLITSEMAKKGYLFLPDENTTYNFKFFVSAGGPEVQVSYDTTSKIIENMMSSPDNLVYLNGVHGAYDIYPKNTILHGVFSRVVALKYRDSIKKAVAELPSCSDLKDKTEFMLEIALANLTTTIEHNKNPRNNSFLPAFDDVWVKNSEKYCIIDYTKPKCDDEESRYYHAKSVVYCTSKVKFRIKGDPRTFENYSHPIQGYAQVRDRVNYPVISLVWNVPLLGIPAVIGGVITTSMAKREAKKDLKKYLSEFQACVE